MGFLDNLESNLESLESRDERESQRDQQRRAEDAAAARATAPFAEALKSSEFTSQLLDHVAKRGFARRVKVHIAWLGDTLRLEAREKKLELRPTAEGIIAVFIENGAEMRRETTDLSGDPDRLARDWLGE